MSLDGQPVAIYVMPAHISETTYLIACNAKKRDLVEGVLYIYKGTELLRTLLVQEPVQAFIFGPYGFGELGFIFNTQGKNNSIHLRACSL